MRIRLPKHPLGNAFAFLYSEFAPLDRHAVRMRETLSGSYQPFTYPMLESILPDLKLTPWPAIEAALKTVPRAGFLHPFMQFFAAVDIQLPIYCSPEVEIAASRIVDALHSGRKPSQADSDKHEKGEHYTTSQPCLIMAVLAMAGIKPGDRVLDIGSGCGYQAALASALARPGTVRGIEKIVELAEFSKMALSNCNNITITQADALKGFQLSLGEQYNAIISGAAMTQRMALNFMNLLVPNGRLVAPILMEGGENGDSIIIALEKGENKDEKDPNFHSSWLLRVSYTPLK